LTYAPWEKDPDFFSDLKCRDPYYFTKILLSMQDIYQQVLERAMGRSDRILISILEFLGKNKKFARSREKVRNLIKELNLVYGTKKIIALDRASLKNLIENTATELKIPNG
jgi:MoxR-like ATPase